MSLENLLHKIVLIEEFKLTIMATRTAIFIKLAKSHQSVSSNRSKNYRYNSESNSDGTHNSLMISQRAPTLIKDIWLNKH